MQVMRPESSRCAWQSGLAKKNGAASSLPGQYEADTQPSEGTWGLLLGPTERIRQIPARRITLLRLVFEQVVVDKQELLAHRLATMHSGQSPEFAETRPRGLIQLAKETGQTFLQLMQNRRALRGEISPF